MAEQDLQDAFRAGLDTVSDNRRRLLLSIAQGRNCETTGLPPTVIAREIEELDALGLTVTNAGTPQLTRQTARLLKTATVLINDLINDLPLIE